jgi:hypothetical protein
VTLTTDHAKRKMTPICTGVLDYFPGALAEIARVSLAGNRQHGLSTLHWDKSKSTDEADALVRHLMQRGTLDTDGMRHSAKVAWRALALLQRELDSELEPGGIRSWVAPDYPSEQEVPVQSGSSLRAHLGRGCGLAYDNLDHEGLLLDENKRRALWEKAHHPVDRRGRVSEQERW